MKHSQVTFQFPTGETWERGRRNHTTGLEAGLKYPVGTVLSLRKDPVFLAVFLRGQGLKRRNWRPQMNILTFLDI